VVEDDKKTLFNAGVAKLMRIDYIKKNLHWCRVNDDEQGRSRWLESYRSEINERLNKEEKEKCCKYKERIISLLKFSSGTDKFDTNILDKTMDDYELFLADLEYKYGFSMPDAEDAGAVLR